MYFVFVSGSWGLSGSCSAIEGERDSNFYGPLFVLAQKINKCQFLVFFLKCDFFINFTFKNLDFSQ